MTEKKPAVKKTDKADPTNEMELILGRKKGAMKFVPVQLDGDVREKLQAANDAVLLARQYDRKNNVSTPTEIAAQTALDKITATAKETEIEFSFRSIGRTAWEDLVRKHTVKPEVQKETGSDVDMANFAPELISVASVSPKISLEQAGEIWDSPDWNEAEANRIFAAARDANIEIPDIPLSSSGIEQILSSILK